MYTLLHKYVYMTHILNKEYTISTLLHLPFLLNHACIFEIMHLSLTIYILYDSWIVFQCTHIHTPWWVECV